MTLTVGAGRTELFGDKITVIYGKSKTEVDRNDLNPLEKGGNMILLDTKLTVEGYPVVDIYINGQLSAKGVTKLIYGNNGTISTCVCATELLVESDLTLWTLQNNVVELDTRFVSLGTSILPDGKTVTQGNSLHDVYADGVLIGRAKTTRLQVPINDEIAKLGIAPIAIKPNGEELYPAGIGIIIEELL